MLTPQELLRFFGKVPALNHINLFKKYTNNRRPGASTSGERTDFRTEIWKERLEERRRVREKLAEVRSSPRGKRATNNLPSPPSTSSSFSESPYWLDLLPNLLHDTMNFSSDLALSDEYLGFRSSVPLKKIAVEADSSKVWKLYDAGPRSVRTPLVCLPPVSGTADVFYRQILSLTLRGIRVIAVEAPVYWCVNDWCEGFKKLLDHMDITRVHLFGASLGGFLAQKFAEYTYQYSRVASIILCNSFRDTSIFNYNQSAAVFWMMPSLVLKKFIIGNLESNRMDLPIARSIDFMSERLDTLDQSELASRLTLTCVNNYVDTFKLRNVKITMVDVFDESALTNQARDDLYKSYPHAKLAHLKSGGNFPYLSRSDEVNMHLMIHLRQFNGTKFSASEHKADDVIDVAAGIMIQAIAPPAPARVI